MQNWSKFGKSKRRIVPFNASISKIGSEVTENHKRTTVYSYFELYIVYLVLTTWFIQVSVICCMILNLYSISKNEYYTIALFEARTWKKSSDRYLSSINTEGEKWMCIMAVARPAIWVLIDPAIVYRVFDW
jgi:hypothetical protein